MKLLLLFLIIPFIVDSRPFTFKTSEKSIFDRKTPKIAELKCNIECQKNYLMKYDYLPRPLSPQNVSTKLAASSMSRPTEGFSSPLIASKENDPNNISEAIINLQRDAGIEETGVFNSETYNLMQTPRCGNKRFARQKRFVILNGWKTLKNEMNETVATWYLDLSNFKQIKTNLTLDTIKSIMITSMTRWSKTSLLRFKEVDDATKANITIQFLNGDHGDSYEFDGPGNVLAHAFYPDTTKLGGDIHFDLDEEWTLWNENKGISLFNVAIHELGHSLGIGHSSQNTSIMYAWYKPNNVNLSDDDVHAINQLYGVRSEYKFGPIDPKHRIYRPFTTTTRPFTTTTRPFTTTTRPFTTTQKYNLPKIRNLLIQNSKVFIYPNSATLSI